MTDIDIETLAGSLRNAVLGSVYLEPRGDEVCLVHTGFVFPDGDELHIVIRRNGDGWTLTDDAHTMMWLSYENPDMDTTAPAIEGIASSNGVSLVDGCLSIGCAEEDIWRSLTKLVQAILQVAGLIHLEE